MDSDMFLYVSGWSYVAGFFDGEGSVVLVRSRWNGSEKVYPTINFTNTCNDVVLWVKEFLEQYDITIHYRAKNRPTVNRLVVYELAISDKKSIMEFINHIRPYLKVKGDAVDNAAKVLKNNMTREEYWNRGRSA